MSQAPATPPPTLRLDEATERGAVNLLRHLEWQPDGFSLVFLFADVGPALQLADWLDERLVGQALPLHRDDAGDRFVDAPEAAVDALIAQLAAMSARPGATWFALHRHPSDARWNQARRLFLARLNERRFLLERDLRRPLVLVLPADFRAEARGIAPDIWHVRALSEEARALPTGDLAPLAAKTGSSSAAGEPTPAARHVATDEWQRTLVIGARDRAYLPTAWRACEELLAAGQLEQADAVAAGALALALRQLTDPPTARALRDLSTSLNVVGRVAEAQGRWHDAEAAYRASLTRLREAVDGSADTPEALRDVAAAARQVGRAAAAQGDWPQADAAFREALSLRQQLLAQRGATAQALRDLATALDDLGQVAEAQGGLEEAESLYRDALATSRRRLDAGERPDPSALRDLAGALDSVGRVALSRGELARADAAYREALAVHRRLVETPGSTGDTLHELSLSLDNVARVAQARGDWAEADAAFSESLAVSKQLVERRGETPEALRDLGLSLVNLGRVARRQGDSAREQALYDEYLGVTRQRVERLGDAPEALRDLVFALNEVGEAAEARGDRSQADAAYREALSINRRLVEGSRRSPDALRDLSAALRRHGRIAQAAGEWADAAAAHRERLALQRELVERLGDSPDALDELATAMLDVASVSPGDIELRRSALDIYQALAQRFPGVQRHADALASLRGDNPAPTEDVPRPTS